MCEVGNLVHPPCTDLANSSQTIIQNIAHKIALHLQFCQEYMFIAGRKHKKRC